MKVRNLFQEMLTSNPKTCTTHLKKIVWRIDNVMIIIFTYLLSLQFGVAFQLDEDINQYSVINILNNSYPSIHRNLQTFISPQCTCENDELFDINPAVTGGNSTQEMCHFDVQQKSGSAVHLDVHCDFADYTQLARSKCYEDGGFPYNIALSSECEFDNGNTTSLLYENNWFCFGPSCDINVYVDHREYFANIDVPNCVTNIKNTDAPKPPTGGKKDKKAKKVQCAKAKKSKKNSETKKSKRIR